MVMLQIKNKYEVTFRKLVNETRGDGGVPDVLQVSGKEAWDILNEIRAVGMRGFEVEASDEYDPQFMLRSSKEKLDKEAATELVNRWWKKEFRVNFRDGNKKIPIHVVNVPKPSKPPPPPPPPEPETTESADKPTPPETED